MLEMALWALGAYGVVQFTDLAVNILSKIL